jgi:hypothetical protein
MNERQAANARLTAKVASMADDEKEVRAAELRTMPHTDERDLEWTKLYLGEEVTLSATEDSKSVP